MKNLEKPLLRFLEAVVFGCGETDEQKELFWGFLTGWIPASAAKQVFAEKGLKANGTEKKLYADAYRRIREDIRTEHLSNQDLSTRLSELTLKVVEEAGASSPAAALRDVVEEFLSGILSPLENFEVLFRVDHLDAEIDEINLRECKLVRCTFDWLAAWGLDDSRPQIASPDYFADRNGILVQERGNNPKEIVRRARLTANRRIQALKSYLKIEYVHDFQLLFEVSERYAMKNLSTRRISSGAERSKKTPLKYDYPESLQEQVDLLNSDFEIIRTFGNKTQELLDRTQYWIGLSISEYEMDIKIAHLCTALETLLTTKSDRRKGEKIAYRGYLLSMEAESARIYQPQKVLALYEKRSTVVHGADFGIALQNDYWTLLGFAKTTFRNFIVFGSRHQYGRQTKLYRGLLKSRHIIPLVTCWSVSQTITHHKKSCSQLKKTGLRVSYG